MMSHINVGFVSDRRSCSRILKPPGGGYSEPFFTDEEAARKTDNASKAPTPLRKTEIHKIFQQDVDSCDSTPPVAQQNGKDTTHTAVNENGQRQQEQDQQLDQERKLQQQHQQENGQTNGDRSVMNSSTSLATNNGLTPASEKPPTNNVKASEGVQDTTPKRVRVPPGGFASALW